MTKSSTALDSEGERGNMTRGCYLKIYDELECKLLNNCPPISISTIVYRKERTNNRECICCIAIVQIAINLTAIS